MKRLAAFLFLFCALAQAGWLTPQEREALWREARAQLLGHPRLAYHNQADLPEYPGYIVTNETAYWTMKPPPGSAKIQVGFATIVNFNILAARRGTALIAVDQSEEAVVSMMSYWRPLFLASETPEEFIAYTAAFVPRDGDTVGSLFRRVNAHEKGTNAGLQAFEEKLSALVKARKISSFDRTFALAVTRDQIPNPRAGEVPTIERQLPSGLWTIERGEKPVYVFRKARGGTDIALGLAHVYGIRAQTPEEAAARRLLSFLEKPGFDHIRSVMAKRDYYAVGSISDADVWRGVTTICNRVGDPMTDLYLSNIPGVSQRSGVNLSSLVDRMKHTVPGQKLATYEASAAVPYPFSTKIEERNRSGVYELVSFSDFPASDGQSRCGPRLVDFIHLFQ